MSSSPHVPLHALQFYATAPYSCSYLPNQTARSQVASPSHLINSETYALLLAQGFRRGGLFTYRPYCDGCQKCVPLRVKVNDYKPNRSQRRAWARHQDLEARILKLSFDPEHYALYSRYQANRHTGGGMDEHSQEQYIQFLLQSHVTTHLVEFRTSHDSPHPNQLKMVSIVDILSDGISAVYTFYEPEPRTSYGTYSILWQIQQAKQLNMLYAHLGYWIQENPKMRYKENFYPHERLIDGVWQEVNFI